MCAIPRRATAFGLLVLGGLGACRAPRGPALVGEQVQAQRVCAPGATVDGIDLSHHQGEVDWPAVAAGGVRFAFLKATEGVDYVDATFAGHWSAARANRVLRGAYHYFHPKDDPLVQAQFFLDTVGPIGDGDLPPVLDLEVGDGASQAQIAAAALTWLVRVGETTGKVPLLYTSPTFFEASVGAPAEFARFPLYIANYNVSCPEMGSTFASWLFWQHSESGTVAGVKGGVDLDRFNGDLDALAAVARGGQSSSPSDGGLGTPDGHSRPGAGDDQPPEGGGCAVSRARPAPRLPLWLVALGVAAALVRRRLRAPAA
jgi:lysozyme